MRVPEPVRCEKDKRASCLRDCFPADDKKPVTPLPGGWSSKALAVIRAWRCHSSGNFFFENAFSGRLRPVRHCDGREPLNGGRS
jgi:hypothetical protein